MMPRSVEIPSIRQGPSESRVLWKRCRQLAVSVPESREVVKNHPAGDTDGVFIRERALTNARVREDYGDDSVRQTSPSGIGRRSEQLRGADGDFAKMGQVFRVG